MNCINYDIQLPFGFKFSLREMNDEKILNIHMAKKLINIGELEYIKIGNKTHISRFELVRYFSARTRNCNIETIMTNYDKQLPAGFKFSLRELEDARIIDVAMAKKLIKANTFVYMKIGNKLHITRDELLRYFNENTFRKAQK